MHLCFETYFYREQFKEYLYSEMYFLREQFWRIVFFERATYVYEYRYLKAKVREFDCVIKTNFLGNDTPKKISIILVLLS